MDVADVVDVVDVVEEVVHVVHVVEVAHIRVRASTSCSAIDVSDAVSVVVRADELEHGGAVEVVHGVELVDPRTCGEAAQRRTRAA